MLGFGKKDSLDGIILPDNQTDEKEIKEIVKKVKAQVTKSKVQVTGEVVSLVREDQGRNRWIRAVVIVPLKTGMDLKLNQKTTLIQ